MVKLNILVIIIFVTLLSIVVIPCLTNAATIRVPANYSTIQGAIDAAGNNDTIAVNSGTYHENIIIDKPVILKGIDSGNGQPIVDGQNGYAAFDITANCVTLQGFWTTDAVYGIFIESQFNNVSLNTVSDNSLESGIYIHDPNNNVSLNTANNNKYGIRLYSSNNTITGNNVSNNQYGIFISGSSNNIVYGNTAYNNSQGGIYSGDGSNNNNLSNNIVNNNIGGIFISGSDNNISYNIANNDNSYGIYFYNSSNNSISWNIMEDNNYGIDLYGNSNIVSHNTANSNQYGICLFSASSNNNVLCNSISNNSKYGIFLSYSSNNNLSQNVANSNFYGIYIYGSNNNVYQNVLNNNSLGIHLDISSRSNILWLNLFEGNLISANVSYTPGGCLNYWNSTAPLKYVYKGQLYTNYTGNYWVEFNNTDVNGDGIGDKPYGLDVSNIDYYPMLQGTSSNNYTSFNIPLKQGWNLVSSPLVVDPAINVSVFKGTNISMVAQYNHTTGGFDIYRVGKTPLAFPFVEGQGYFLYCSNNANFTIIGLYPSSLSTIINQGWSLIGWTNMMVSNSKLLATGLYNVTMLARYNTTTGSYDIYRVGKTPTPFTVQAGEGYFLYTTNAEPQTLVMY